MAYRAISLSYSLCVGISIMPPPAGAFTKLIIILDDNIAQ